MGEKSHTVLGLDIGPNSLGWAVIDKTEGRQHVIDSGVRAFEAGLDQLEKDGKGVSRNVERRDARSARRRLERHTRRLANLARLLQRSGLMPPGKIDKPEQRHEFFQAFDRQLATPYQLRAKGLDEPLTPNELGRALYHIAQRRGFLSNRKAPLKDEKKKGEVQTGIDGLSKEIAETGARTLGEYFAKKSEAGKERVRTRYTSRTEHYEQEFKLLWDAQRRFHPELLADEVKKKIHRGIFYQRPLKSQAKFIGHCDLEPTRRRAPWALLLAQRYRYLQKIDDLELTDTATGEKRKLTDEERRKLAEKLESQQEITFPGIRKALGLPKTITFNLEEGGEKKLPGNRTAGRLASIFGEERWQALSEAEKDSVVEDYLSIVKDDTLVRRGKNRWGLGEEAAKRLGQVSLDTGYCQYSRQALVRLVPKLESGVQLQTAIKECYPERFERSGKCVDLLPPVREAGLGELRNPIVERALTELRRVVNAIIARHGKPAEIHIELGRDLRQNAKQREKATKQMRLNEEERKIAAEECMEEGIENPTPTDILKAVLRRECGGFCPYTGKAISMKALFGPHPQFDIEHIIPFDRCLDDSYMNKTLCWAEENRNVKHSRTPYEAYHGTVRWDEITEGVRRFKGRAAWEKRHRFTMTSKQVEEFIAGFTSRQLNDTRWASKWAKRYLGLLYGGADDDGIDAFGKRRVLATAGGMTAYLRDEWGLNAILGDGGSKPRHDHRHHAVDAVVVALTDQSMVNQLSAAAGRAAKAGRRRFDQVLPPWEGFKQEVGKKIDCIVVSHRVDNRVCGALHKETFYGHPRKDDKGMEWVHLRVPLNALSEKDVKDIADPAIRECVKNKLTELGGDQKTAFKTEDKYPYDPQGNRIRHVRVRYPFRGAQFPIGKGSGERWVESKNLHHMEVTAVLDDAGNVKKWNGHVVSLLEAYRRLAEGKPVIQRDFGPKEKFLFSLAGREVMELDANDGKRGLFVVRSLESASGNVRFVPINDSRRLDDIGKAGLTALPNSLRKKNCRKFVVTPLGDVRRAND